MRKPLPALALLLLLAGAALVVCPLLGMKFIPLSADGLEREILLSLRVPRVVRREVRGEPERALRLICYNICIYAIYIYRESVYIYIYIEREREIGI